jgi:hypothetical protein
MSACVPVYWGVVIKVVFQFYFNWGIHSLSSSSAKNMQSELPEGHRQSPTRFFLWGKVPDPQGKRGMVWRA